MISTQAFQNHLVEYHSKVWPVLILVQIVAIICMYMTFKKNKKVPSRLISGFLAFLWILDGVVHQWWLGGFSLEDKLTIVPLFTLQGILFLIFGVFKDNLSYKVDKSPYSVLGIFFILYSFIAYPIIGWVSHFGFPKGPVLGLICPSTIFTYGYLLLTERKMSKWLLAIPCFWAIVGGVMAIMYWGAWNDIGLVSSGVIGTLLLVTRSKKEEVGTNKALQV